MKFSHDNATVYVIDDDPAVRTAIALLLETEAIRVKTYGTSQAFLDEYDPQIRGCIVLDIQMPGMDGLTLQETLRRLGSDLPIIFLTGQGTIPIAVQAVKNGASDFLEKPASSDELLERIRQALSAATERHAADSWTSTCVDRYRRLTQRQRDVMRLVTSGLPNKVVARELGISPRTAEGHRLKVMERMQAGSLVELIAMARACGESRLSHG